LRARFAGGFLNLIRSHGDGNRRGVGEHELASAGAVERFAEPIGVEVVGVA
jgi:hypothetical protein